jgi:hypothetical protein
MKRVFVLLAVLTLGACASNGAEKSPRSYAGVPEQALVAALGAPAAIDEAGGVRTLSYRQHRSFYIPAMMPYYQPICPPTDCVPLGGARGYMLNEECVTTFTIEDGKVKSWRREGKNCIA